MVYTLDLIADFGLVLIVCCLSLLKIIVIGVWMNSDAVQKPSETEFI